MSEKEESIARVDRRTAAKINPLIDSVAYRETLFNVSETLTLLGEVFVCSENSKVPVADFGRLHYLLTALTGALNYEAQQDEEPKVKEAPVTRVK